MDEYVKWVKLEDSHMGGVDMMDIGHFMLIRYGQYTDWDNNASSVSVSMIHVPKSSLSEKVMKIYEQNSKSIY